jgi:hypothetical protein
MAAMFVGRVRIGLGVGCGTRAPGAMRGDADASLHGIARSALAAIGIDRMTRDVLAEAIPLSGAEYVAEQRLEALECVA